MIWEASLKRLTSFEPSKLRTITMHANRNNRSLLHFLNNCVKLWDKGHWNLQGLEVDEISGDFKSNEIQVLLSVMNIKYGVPAKLERVTTTQDMTWFWVDNGTRISLRKRQDKKIHRSIMISFMLDWRFMPPVCVVNSQPPERTLVGKQGKASPSPTRIKLGL